MTTSTETTSAYAMSQVIANAINQNSDLNVSARPSEGTNANIGRLARGESDMAYVQNWTANKVTEGERPFQNIDYTPHQVFHLYDLAWFLCTANDGWKSVTDIESGATVSPTPRGSGTAEMLQHSLSYVTEDYERVSIKYSSQGGAMSSGRLDVGAGTFINGTSEPGWLQQMKGAVNLRVLQWPDDVISKLKEDPAIITTSIDTSTFRNYGYIPDTLNTPSLAYNFVVRGDFDGETLKTFLNTLWEQRKGLGESNALLSPMSDRSFFMQNGYSTLPFHPAAAEFYKEKGVWKDKYKIGEQ
jgi:TRAP transporter TAXI family solute receptor